MAQTIKRWTRADLASLPDDGNSYEVIHGELFVGPAPRSRHQRVVVVIARIIGRYVDAHGLGDVHHPRSVIVVDDSEVEPDLMVLPPLGAPLPEWEDMPRPLLVVEVISESTKRRDRIAKRGLYLEARIPEYWIVDGDARSITVVRPDQPDAVVDGRLVWSPQGPAEALEIDVAAVFREALE